MEPADQVWEGANMESEIEPRIHGMLLQDRGLPEDVRSIALQLLGSVSEYDMSKNLNGMILENPKFCARAGALYVWARDRAQRAKARVKEYRGSLHRSYQSNWVVEDHGKFTVAALNAAIDADQNLSQMIADADSAETTQEFFRMLKDVFFSRADSMREVSTNIRNEVKAQIEDV